MSEYNKQIPLDAVLPSLKGDDLMRVLATGTLNRPTETHIFVPDTTLQTIDLQTMTEIPSLDEFTTGLPHMTSEPTYVPKSIPLESTDSKPLEEETLIFVPQLWVPGGEL